MIDAKDLIDRVKNLKYYEVKIAVPEDFEFRGRIPFHIRIEDDVALCRVLAADIIEAERKVLEYFRSQI